MATSATGTTPVQLGQAIRAAREARGLSLRELARRVSVSPSFVSQIELGKANPSVGTLYSVVSVLGTTLDDLIGEQPGGSGSELVDASLGRRCVPGQPGRRSTYPLQPAEGRKRVEMSGVVWERLTADHDPYVDFLHVEYAPGSSSCAPEQMMRHGGREYGHLPRRPARRPGRVRDLLPRPRRLDPLRLDDPASPQQPVRRAVHRRLVRPLPPGRRPDEWGGVGRAQFPG